MRFDEMVVEIETRENGGYKARILRGPYGRAKNVFIPPFSPVQAEQQLTRLEKMLRAAIRAQYQYEKATRAADAEATKKCETKLNQAQETLLHTQHQVGRRLLGQLFQGPLERKLERCLGLLRDRAFKERLRIHLVFDPHEEQLLHLAALPWELLCRLDTDEFLGRSRKTTIARYLETDQLIEPFQVKGRLQVLLVDCSPTNLPRLRVRDEEMNIREALQKLQEVDVEVCRDPSVKTLHRRLRYGSPVHVLHFMGHGGFEPGTGEGTLAFVDENGGDERTPGATILEMFKELEHLQLVVLSTCHGGAHQRHKGQFPYLGIAPAVLRAGVPAVVAMQFPISDEAALTFSEAFYHALSRFDPVDVAVAQGRKEVVMNSQIAGEWATPTLFLRVAGGRLFEPAEGEESDTAENRASQDRLREAESFQIGIRSGVRSFERDHAPDLESEVQTFLDLSKRFDDNRVIRTPDGWQRRVFPKLEAFLHDAMDDAGRRTLDLNMAVHATIAFAAGYCLEAKSGFDVQLRQRMRNGDYLLWKQDDPRPMGALWHEETERVIDAEASDVALAVSVTVPVLTDVEEFVEDVRLPVGRILPVTVAPEPGQLAVTSGTHALALAQQLANIIRQRTRAERRGVLHIFCAAPNSLLFFLGQQARTFGRVQLYEHDLASGKLGAYRPSLRLPPQIAWAQETGPEEKMPGEGREYSRWHRETATSPEEMLPGDGRE